MKTTKFTLVILLATAILLQACGASGELSSSQATLAAQEALIGELENQLTAAQAQAADSGRNRDSSQAPLAANTDDAASDAEAADTAEVVVLGNGIITVSEDTNCRSGPRVDYDLVAIVMAGEELEVVATYPFAPYVVIKTPRESGNCWLWLEYADSSDLSGQGLPEATQPPTPIADPDPFDWSGNWRVWVEGDPYIMYVYVNGNHFTGEFIAANQDHVVLSGTLDGNHQMVTGTFQWGGRSESFVAYARVTAGNIFVGQWGPGLADFCGARAGVQQPHPCLGP
jgi:hypothetical protein